MKKTTSFTGGGGPRVALAVCLCLAGCGRPRDFQPTVPVSGVVTYRGQPVPQGRIQFAPDMTGPGVRAAFGNLDSRGRYTLSTYGKGDGAIVGTHRVAIVARRQAAAPFDREAVAAGLTSGPPSLIPEHYGNGATSGLTAEVQPGPNTINFDLGD